MSSGIPAQSTFSSLNFTGGFPDSRDLAPSIIFLILYVASVPVLVGRFWDHRSRCRLLIRPSIFVLARLGTLGLRAAMSKMNYDVYTLIAELILVSIGYLFLISPLTSLWSRLAEASAPPPKPVWIDKISKLLQLTLLASIATAIASGAMTSGAFNSQSGLQTVVNLRHASIILSLIVVVITLLALAATFVIFRTDTVRTAYLLIPGFSLLIVAVYRTAQSFDYNPASASRTLAAFWVLDIFFEFILAIRVPEWYPDVSKQETGLRGERLASEAETGMVQARAPAPLYPNKEQPRRFGR